MLKIIKSLFSHSTRSLLILTITSFGLSCGIIPEFSRQSHALQFNFAVSAQTPNFTSTQLEHYARAVLTMESERLATYDFIKEKAGTVPEISCYQTVSNEIEPISRNALRSQLQTNLSQLNNSQLNQVVDRAFNYCRFAQRTVHDSGLSSTDFNNITNNWQQLAPLLNPIFIRLQQN